MPIHSRPRAERSRHCVRAHQPLSGAALAIVLLTSVGTGPAFAATTAPFQVSVSKACKESPCKLVVGRVARKTRLLIDSVSCWISGSGGLELKEAGLFAGGKRYDALAPERLAFRATDGYFAFNRQTHFFANAREKVTLRFVNDPALSFEQVECKVAGGVEKLG